MRYYFATLALSLGVLYQNPTLFMTLMNYGLAIRFSLEFYKGMTQIQQPYVHKPHLEVISKISQFLDVAFNKNLRRGVLLYQAFMASDKFQDPYQHGMAIFAGLFLAGYAAKKQLDINYRHHLQSVEGDAYMWLCENEGLPRFSLPHMSINRNQHMFANSFIANALKFWPEDLHMMSDFFGKLVFGGNFYQASKSFVDSLTPVGVATQVLANGVCTIDDYKLAKEAKYFQQYRHLYNIAIRPHVDPDRRLLNEGFVANWIRIKGSKSELATKMFLYEDSGALSFVGRYQAEPIPERQR